MEPISEISHLVLTSDDRSTLLGLLDGVEQVNYSPGRDFAGLFNQSGSAGRFQDYLLSQLERLDAAGVAAYLKGLRGGLSSFRQVKLTVAVTPTPEFIAEIVALLRRRLGRDVLLFLEIDRYIMAGIVSVFEGYYVDLSLEKLIHQALDRHREEVVSLLA